MSQLSELIAQAKKQRGLDDLFSAQTISSDLGQGDRAELAKPTLISKLEELEVQLFPCLHLSSSSVDELIRTLEAVREGL